jgi:hypothetical protein
MVWTAANQTNLNQGKLYRGNNIVPCEGGVKKYGNEKIPRVIRPYLLINSKKN